MLPPCSIYMLQDHFIQRVKYRRKALDHVALPDFLKQKVREIGQRFGVDVILNRSGWGPPVAPVELETVSKREALLLGEG